MRWLRIAMLRARRACAAQEIRQARRQGIRSGVMLREWSMQVDRYDRELARLGVEPPAPLTSPPLGVEAAWADTGGALTSSARQRDMREEGWGWLFRSALVAVALGLLLVGLWRIPLP